MGHHGGYKGKQYFHLSPFGNYSILGKAVM